MKKNLIRLSVVLFLFTVIISGCGKSDEHKDMDMGTSERKVDSTFIRNADIEVASLDANGDGNVYNCPMHFNVISDNKDTCPECMMDLEQVSVADAQKSLKENNQ